MPQSRDDKTYYSHILWAVLAVIYLIYQMFESGLISPRLAEILHGSEIISGGGLPYLDFQTMISPAIFYLNSFLNNNLLLIKLISGLNIILISTCIYYLSGKIINKENAIYPSFLSLILISVVSPWGVAWLFALLFILISTIFIFKYLENNTKIKYVFYSGLMLGLASLFRHEMAGFIFGAIFQAVFFMSLSHPKADLMQKKEKMVYGLKNALVLALGLIPVLPFAIYLLIKIPINIIWKQLFVSPFVIFRTDGNIPFPSLFNFDLFNIFDLWFGIIFYSTLIMIIFLVYYIVKNVKSKNIELNGVKFWQLLMIFNICLNLFNIPMIASDYWHFLPVLICGNIVLFLFISEINNKLINKFTKIITLIFILSVISLPINN
jgi:Dolichyl-phosphate-mannose-protein mannosyltransferase